ncbi:MAG: glutathione S-transferase family protein [Bdellovibrionota bacterium]
MAGTIELHQWEISPYCEKIRKILDYKEIPYRTIEQPLLRRTKLQKETGQQKVPVINDGGKWVADSTDVARYLEETYPQKPILPKNARDRALCFLIEDWADEAFASTVQPTKWLTPGNMEKLLGIMQENLPGAGNALLLRVAGPALAQQMKGMMMGRGKKRTSHLFAYQLDLLDALLADAPYLFGETPTVADFAVAALVRHLRDLKGYEEVTRRRKFTEMIRRIDEIPSKRAG